MTRASSDKPTLTEDQRRGVQTVGVGLLMSAAAGSGKTRVLAERCAYLVCDAPAEYRCEVNELLVVTFTEAAAAEMRDRIGRALDARMRQSPDARLQRQRLLLDQAQVSTLHSFCAQLLRQHFHLVGLDPGFTVMDPQEATLLRLDVGRAMLRHRYGEDSDGRFQRLLDHSVEGDDERLLHEIFRIHDLLGSLVDPLAWLTAAEARIRQASAGKLDDSELGKRLLVLLKRRIAAMGQRCNSVIAQIQSLGHFGPYEKRVQEMRDICRHLYALVGSAGIDAVAEMVNETTFDRMKPVPGDTPNKEQARDVVARLMKEFKSGPWRMLLNFSAEQWQDGLQRLQPPMAELLGLVRRFHDDYRRAKDEARQLDFADLERYALNVLLADPSRPAELRPSSAARLQHRLYKHVLVDEFQDINEIQNAILHLVSHESREEGGRTNGDASDSSGLPPSSNLFCVGDVKQSIYRFRLADPEQFLRRESALRRAEADNGAGQVIDLKQNFRSRGPLLEAINAVFSRLMTRAAAEIEYDSSQRLVPGRVFADPGAAIVFPGAPIELHLLTKPAEPAGDPAGPAPADIDDGDAGWDRTEREAAFVAQRILKMLGQDPDRSPPMYVYDREKATPRPAQYGDIVILLRSKKYKANQFVRILEGFGIPTHAESGSGFFECTEIRDMVALLCLMDNQQQDLELAAWLRSPLARLPEPEDSLARVCIAYRELRFHDAVVRYAAEKTDDLARRLAELLDDLAQLRRQANRQPVHETIWSIYERTGYLAYVAGLPGGRQRSANLLELYDRARRFGTHRRQGLGRFLEFLKTLEAESDIGQAAVASDAEDVVRIMTVHRSKGLEFPIVILPDCGKKINFRDETGAILLDRHLGVGMAVADEKLFARYPSLAQVLVKDQIHRKAMAEELRILYVAMTRAMEHLILVGTTQAETSERWKKSWGKYRGPLPEAAVASAQTMLDWLGPVWAATQGSREPWIELELHPFDSIEDPRTRRQQQELSPQLKALCDRKPIDPAPPADARAREVIERLSFVYPFERQTRLPAAASVTAITKEHDAGRDLSPGRDFPAGVAAKLELPPFMVASGQPTARQIGSATHAALQHLRFGGIETDADVERQLDELVERRKLTPGERAAVDAAAIAWFVRSDLGQFLREHEPRLMRELPVSYAMSPESESSASGLDATMIRGRLDVFLPLPQGGVILDYKTDNGADPAAMEALAEQYFWQLDQYAVAMERITGVPVKRRCLVFLSARVIVER